MALPVDFMARVVDWPGLSGPGYVNLHWTVPPSKGHGLRGRPFKELHEFMNDAQRMASNPTAYKEVYFCLSKQKDHGGQGKFGRLKAHRHASKALSLKALWIDLDCGPSKDYATQVDALTALTTFVTTENLPTPTALVNSGGGIHAYWINTSPLTVEQWRPYAEGLKSLVVQHKLAKDAGLIADAARVLRVPGTFNQKIDGKPRAVKLLHLADTDYDFAATPALARLATLVKVAPPKVTAAVIAPAFELPAAFANGPAKAFSALDAANDRLDLGIQRKDLSLPLLVDEAIKNCQHFRDCAVTKGAKHGQGLWALTLLACTFVEDGDRWARKFSEGYPAYNVDETDAKFAEKQKYKAENDLGWPSCTAFEGEGAKCAGCPFKGKISSPLALCERQEPPTPFVQIIEPDPADPDRPVVHGGHFTEEEALHVINAHYFIGKDDKQIGIFRVNKDGSIAFTTPEQQKLDLGNISVGVGDRQIRGDQFWQGHPNRREARIVFKMNEDMGPGEYNLWRGFAVKPRKGWQKQRRLLRHIREVICRRDKKKFRYLIQWLAYLVQHPEQLPGTVLVLKSRKEGTGKSTVGMVMLKIFGDHHSALIDDKERIVGRFNDWMEPMCFILAEEILWAGDRRSTDKLKSRITAQQMPMERKNGAIWQANNHLHVIMTTNHDHAVAAGVGDRRYIVYDVAEDHANDKAWFAPLYLNGKVRTEVAEEFLWFLQSIKLGDWHPRQAIKTAETIEQQRASGDSVSEWAQACIDADAVVGFPNAAAPPLGQSLSSDFLRDAYAGFCKQHSLRTIAGQTLGNACTQMFGAKIRLPAKGNGKRAWGYAIPAGPAWQTLLDVRLGIT